MVQSKGRVQREVADGPQGDDYGYVTFEDAQAERDRDQGRGTSLSTDSAAGLSDQQVLARRSASREELAGGGGANQGDRLGTSDNLAVLDWEAGERGIAPQPIVFVDPATPPSTPGAMRELLEQAIGSGGVPRAEKYVAGLLSAIARTPDRRRLEATSAWHLAREQLSILKADNDRFERDFEQAARQVMVEVLDQSETSIRKELTG